MNRVQIFQTGTVVKLQCTVHNDNKTLINKTKITTSLIIKFSPGFRQRADEPPYQLEPYLVNINMIELIQT